MNNMLNKTLFGTVTLRSLLQCVVAVLTFAAISWAYFYPADVDGDVLQQSDVMQGTANGQEITSYQQQTGEISRWTDALFGGMPTFQIKPTYSSTPLLSWVGKVYSLGFPQPVSWIFIMMLGFFIMLLAFKVKWYLAVLGAIGYGFSSYFFILIGAGHIWKLLTLAYIPPTIAGIVWCYRGHYLGGAALAALMAALQLLSNHVQMTYYSLFLVAALVVGFLVKAILDKKVGRWCIATGALAVAAMLAVAANAPSLYMSYKYARETIRGGHSELTPLSTDGAPQAQATAGGLDKDYITQWSYGKDETFTLLIPNVKGGATIRPEHGDNVFLSLSDTGKAQSMAEAGEMSGQDFQILQQFPQYFGDQPMTNGPVYVGALICALFLLGCVVVKGPVKWALVVVTFFTMFLSWGHNMMWLTDWMIDYFPMYNKFRTPASILVIAEITMPLLAVLALKEMMTDPDFMKKNRGAFYGSFGFCALVCLVTWLAPGIFGSYSAMEHEQLVASGQIQQYPTVDAAIRAVRGSMVSADAGRSLLVLVLGFAVLMAFVMNKVKASVASAALALVVLVDMYAVDKRYVNQDTFVSHYDVTPTAFQPRPVDVQILQDSTLHYRVLDQQHFAEAMPSYFHKTVGGYHAAKLTRYNDLIERQLSRANMAVLNMLNTRYVILTDSVAQLNAGALGNAWFVDSLAYVAGADAEMAALDSIEPARWAVADGQFQQVLGAARPHQPGDTIALTAYAPNRLTYRAHSAQGGLAVFSEVFFPWGWKATIDGQPAQIGRVNYVLRAMQLPAGDHTVEMVFDPEEVHTTDAVARWAIIAIFVLLLAAVNVAVFRQMKKTKRNDGA